MTDNLQRLLRFVFFLITLYIEIAVQNTKLALNLKRNLWFLISALFSLIKENEVV
jgi:hypothetical protein